MTATLKRNPLPLHSHWLKAEVSSRVIGVDREANALRGMVIAQEGPFKTDGRGMFDLKGLKTMKALINKEPIGLKSNFGHPNDSGDRASAPGYHLGRVKTPFIDVLRIKRNGEEVLVNALRGDLFFDRTALEEPPQGGRPLGNYIMDLADSDPDALSTSVQIEADQEEQLDPKSGKPILDANGEPMPPLWHPRRLHASDLVNVGDAVDGVLSAEGINESLVARATAMLNRQFPDSSPEVILTRCTEFLHRLLVNRFGEEALRKVIAGEPEPVKKANGLSRSVAELDLLLAERGG